MRNRNGINLVIFVLRGLWGVLTIVKLLSEVYWGMIVSSLLVLKLISLKQIALIFLFRLVFLGLGLR